MKRTSQTSSQGISTATTPALSLTLGEYAHQVLQEQYKDIVQHERKVLADEDPEELHKMRVGTRRLRTALQIFGMAVKLPKRANQRRVGRFAKTLGSLRDLDVQIADLQTHYRPALAGDELDLLDGAIATLHKKRHTAFAAVEEALHPDSKKATQYQTLKVAYQHWLDQPEYTASAQLPIVPLLPDLLSPLLSDLLLHPGWLIPANHTATTDSATLHDLRKAFKQVRYQAEFFLPFYGKPFQRWIKEVKTLQDQLGKLQDSQVLAELLAKYLPKHACLPTVQAQIQQTRAEALANWDDIRLRYLEPTFRSQLHHMLLEPTVLAIAPDDESAQASSSSPAQAQAKPPKRTAAKRTSSTIHRDQ